MATTTDWTEPLAGTDAPLDRQRELLDVRSLGPPEPLVETLETLANAPEEVVLVQVNDRAPQHLYPKLEDRGYEYVTVEAGDAVEESGAVVTAVWRATP
jgi:TusA-related sulfurtransferase